MRAACDDAASHFQSNFEGSLPFLRWKQAGGAEPPLSLEWPPRTSYLFFAELSGGVQSGGDARNTLAYGAQLGAVFARWFALQLYAADSRTTFAGALPRDPAVRSASMGVLDLGVEALLCVRMLPYLELRLGPGFHRLSGTATYDAGTPGSSSYSVLAPDLFAELLFAFHPWRSGWRLLAGVSGRQYFDTAAKLDDFSRSIPAASWSVAAQLGVEAPLGDHR